MPWTLLFLFVFGLGALAQETASEHADRAAELVQQGDLSNAEQQLRKAIQLSPDDPAFLTSLGGVLGMEGQLEQGNIYLARAVHLKPNDALLRRNLAANEWQLGRFQSAERDLELLLRANPNDDVAKFLLGMVSENLKKYSRSVALLEPILETMPQRPEALVALASSYYHLNERQKAQSCLNRILTSPASPQILRAGGHLAVEQHDYPLALRILTESARAQPDSYEVFLMKAEAERRLNYFSQAVISSRRALELHSSVDTRRELALVEWHAGDKSQSSSEFEKLTHEFPGNASVYETYGTLLLESGSPEDKSRAIAMLQKAITLDKSSAEAYYQIGNVELAQGHLGQALRFLQDANRTDPADSRVHFALSRVYRRLERNEDADRELRTFEKAQEHSKLVLRHTYLHWFAVVLAAAVLVILASGEIAPIVFTEITQSAGIDWKHSNGESTDRYLIETMGGGVAFLDFDNDGLLDICLVTGGNTPHGKSGAHPLNALYKNLGNGKFRNVAAAAGIDRIPFYGMGIAVADYDNDGFPDIYITGFPSSALFHNNRNGTFSNVTAKAGVANDGKVGASAAWFDYDRDGHLDLFVANYVKFSYDGPQHCTYQGQPTYCAQTAYEGDRSHLYHNNGNGTFTDVTTRTGLSQMVGRALGVVTLDADGDGWPDLFVSRDASPNLLLINQRDGTFRDAAVRAEVAFNADGNARAGMGVDAGDVTGQGWPSLSITNFNDENHALFVNRGHLMFEERTIESGLAALTHQFVGWGVHFLDYDDDGKLDLMMVNGHLNQVIEQTRSDVSYREPPLLLHNRGNATFENVVKLAGPVFQQKFRARGLAIGDFDNDGRTDAIFTRLGDTPILLRNTYESAGNWIGLELQGTRSNRDAIGAKVVLQNGKDTLVRWVQGGGSYLSSHDKRLVFGLGNTPGQTRSIDITWPNGQKQIVRELGTNRYHKVTEPR